MKGTKSLLQPQFVRSSGGANGPGGANGSACENMAAWGNGLTGANGLASSNRPAGSKASTRVGESNEVGESSGDQESYQAGTPLTSNAGSSQPPMRFEKESYQAGMVESHEENAESHPHNEELRNKAYNVFDSIVFVDGNTFNYTRKSMKDLEQARKKDKEFFEEAIGKEIKHSEGKHENNGRAVAQIKYTSAIGCLMYATHYTRPDIAYAICKLSRYTSNPSQDHWKAIGRIFGYLKRTRQLALYYDRFPAVLEGYSDASWITGSSDSKSTTGWIFTLGGGAVCWGSKKQTCITHSTMEAEFLALAAAGKEAEWLRNMLLDIELWPQPMPAISLHCDSQSTLSRAYNKVYNGKSRHISLRHAYIKELISNGIITIEYIRSCKNLTDPFTKGVPKDIVFETTRDMGLKSIE
ncbi:hypothetical protein Tco_1273413 [Tanacetum coccineum]